MERNSDCAAVRFSPTAILRPLSNVSAVFVLICCSGPNAAGGLHVYCFDFCFDVFGDPLGKKVEPKRIPACHDMMCFNVRCGFGSFPPCDAARADGTGWRPGRPALGDMKLPH